MVCKDVLSSANMENNNFPILLNHLTFVVFLNKQFRWIQHEEITENERDVTTNKWILKKVVVVKRGWLLKKILIKVNQLGYKDFHVLLVHS